MAAKTRQVLHRRKLPFDSGTCAISLLFPSHHTPIKQFTPDDCCCCRRPPDGYQLSPGPGHLLASTTPVQQTITEELTRERFVQNIYLAFAIHGLNPLLPPEPHPRSRLFVVQPQPPPSQASSSACHFPCFTFSFCSYSYSCCYLAE